ncbi:MAG: hypothetical protein SPK06_04995 [Kiritimatiellia bacterium]|nr:hypothetical protein [Kiritimatiellia bacterium]
MLPKEGEVPEMWQHIRCGEADYALIVSQAKARELEADVPSV